ncbi:RHS repeat-associated core domain-containing protein [Pseudomonas sp. GM55]|uniref:RHS repeat-associated core domain-containing protein n=1 Tax=Pseudomonas sp. GM55 TaxID=1144333 RepID=UPI0002708F7A|nr:RHS repeat-associated core domain-containing protein [Pseudomonas sp. GM55]EJM72465.1 RHS repeat-associated core domain protein-containing protein [Pseudomonas sp. GM55]
MQPNRETVLCRYHYDPLDRLVDCTPSAQSSTRRFYLKDRLATEVQGTEQRSIMQHEDQLLAQQQRQNGNVETRLLTTDQQRSVLNVLDTTRPHPLAYTAYGHRPAENGLLSLLGFNGERPDPVTGWYLLGNGYRAFNPVLMRFNSPDSWSPFGRGGLNAYAYCVGDPVNRADPKGHTPTFIKPLLRSLRIIKKPAQTVSLNTPIPMSRSTPNLTESSGLTRSPSFSKEKFELASEKQRLNKAENKMKEIDKHFTNKEQKIRELNETVTTLESNGYEIGTAIPDTIKMHTAELNDLRTLGIKYQNKITSHQKNITNLNNRISGLPEYESLPPPYTPATAQASIRNRP